MRQELEEARHRVSLLKRELQERRLNPIIHYSNSFTVTSKRTSCNSLGMGFGDEIKDKNYSLTELLSDLEGESEEERSDLKC